MRLGIVTPVRRAILTSLSCVALVVLLTGCGSKGTVDAAPVTVEGSLPKPTLEPETPAFKLKGDAAAGKKIFASAGCGGCHTLSDAGASGTVGPNLDQAQPDYRLATARVTLGKGAMPSFKDRLSDQEIANVAAYVVTATGGDATP
jgi:mono/diheme cytochrome c family protein